MFMKKCVLDRLDANLGLRIIVLFSFALPKACSDLVDSFVTFFSSLFPLYPCLA